jgi:cytidylate kinase
MVGAGVDFNPEQTMQEMAQRDERDRSRSAAPLIQAPDAVYIDSTALTVEQVVEHILKLVRDRTANGKEYSR